MAGDPKREDERIRIRPATKEDVPGLTECFFRSFNAPFWLYFIPDQPKFRRWWDEVWTIGLDNPTDVSFVAVDTQKNDKVVGFSRWMVPQDDGNLERKWPELQEGDWDMEVAGAFFGGMEENREALMGHRKHWMLELLGTHEDYQRSGIAGRLIRWGTEQADRDGLETYLDGSEVGQPYYIRRHHFENSKPIKIPDKPQYGSFRYMSMVRPSQKAL